MVKELTLKQFARIIIAAGLVASIVYNFFAILGDAIFGDIV
jgi:hypothetical protein